MAQFPVDDLPIYNMEQEEAIEDEELNSRVIHMADEVEQEKAEAPGFWGTVGDVFTQAGLGALKLFTWPADILKLGIIGEGLSDIDELESAFEKAGKPFDRKQYVQAVLDSANYVPTQELGEKGFEKATGISLEPRSELGKIAKQGVGIAAFTPGGALSKLAAAGTGIAATQGLKAAGVEEGTSELIGDITSVSPSLITKAPRVLSTAAQSAKNTAEKFALPFLEFMAREREPLLKGRLWRNTETRLKNQFNLSSEKALNGILNNELPLKRLRDKGVNLDALAEHAYEVTDKLAKASPQTISTNEIVNNIDKKIAYIKSLSPSPSESQKAAIELLERERDILKISKPTSEQIINQHKNYNADMKAIYRKSEFSGKEEQVRKAYEFLKDELVNAMDKQGNKSVANSFKAANKIYHEKQKLLQTENLLRSAFPGDTYNPKKLERLLASKKGNFLRRNLSSQAIEDLEEIAKYGRQAEEKMAKFIHLDSPAVADEVRKLGQLAPFVFMPHNLQGKILAVAKPFAQHIQGKLLTRDATRHIYKLTLKHAAAGAFNLLKKDFHNLEMEITKEWGSVEDFMDNTLDELRIYNE